MISIHAMEPTCIPQVSRHYNELLELVFEVLKESSLLCGGIRPELRVPLARLVRSMNCYYSNLIEGHNTHPIDIERALKADYSDIPDKRDLQQEAQAHVETQEWVGQNLIGKEGHARVVVATIHREFYRRLPERMRLVKYADSDRTEEVIPGAFRNSVVSVGRHVAVESDKIISFLDRFGDVYDDMTKHETVLNAAAAHHRLLWIHPFLDGNGRVARLVSHKMLEESLETGGLWSFARGLSRSEADYKRHLEACDGRKQNDLDGRGTLSEKALVDFTTYFLETCLDQIRFMRSLMDPEKLPARILNWTKREEDNKEISKGSLIVMEEALYKGQVDRARLPERLGVTERHARRVTQELQKLGVLVSERRGYLNLGFPAALAGEWMPGLFPEQ